VDGIQRTYESVYGARSGGRESEQAKQYMDLEHCLCTGYTWSLLTTKAAPNAARNPMRPAMIMSRKVEWFCTGGAGKSDVSSNHEKHSEKQAW
jgi:hypothetical protein